MSFLHFTDFQQLLFLSNLTVFLIKGSSIKGIGNLEGSKSLENSQDIEFEKYPHCRGGLLPTTFMDGPTDEALNLENATFCFCFRPLICKNDVNSLFTSHSAYVEEGGIVEELFTYIFGIYIKFGYKNPSILTPCDSVNVAT